MQIWLKSGNGPIDVFLCPDNKENTDPNSDASQDTETSDGPCQSTTPIKIEPDDIEYNADELCARFSQDFDDDLIRIAQQCQTPDASARRRQRTLSSMNSPESSFIDEDDIKVEEELMSYEHIPETDQTVAATLDANFDSEEYLFSLEQNEGITDLFGVL